MARKAETWRSNRQSGQDLRLGRSSCFYAAGSTMATRSKSQSSKDRGPAEPRLTRLFIRLSNSVAVESSRGATRQRQPCRNSDRRGPPAAVIAQTRAWPKYTSSRPAWLKGQLNSTSVRRPRSIHARRAQPLRARLQERSPARDDGGPSPLARRPASQRPTRPGISAAGVVVGAVVGIVASQVAGGLVPSVVAGIVGFVASAIAMYVYSNRAYRRAPSASPLSCLTPCAATIQNWRAPPRRLLPTELRAKAGDRRPRPRFGPLFRRRWVLRDLGCGWRRASRPGRERLLDGEEPV